MIRTASDLIDALDGTTAVARLVKSNTSTVHSWRRNGIPEARLDHLILAAEKAGKLVPEYHAADIMRPAHASSSGSDRDNSHRECVA